jgi:hypothetical protein
VTANGSDGRPLLLPRAQLMALTFTTGTDPDTVTQHLVGGRHWSAGQLADDLELCVLHSLLTLALAKTRAALAERGIGL